MWVHFVLIPTQHQVTNILKSHYNSCEQHTAIQSFKKGLSNVHDASTGLGRKKANVCVHSRHDVSRKFFPGKWMTLWATWRHSDEGYVRERWWFKALGRRVLCSWCVLFIFILSKIDCKEKFHGDTGYFRIIYFTGEWTLTKLATTGMTLKMTIHFGPDYLWPL